MTLAVTTTAAVAAVVAALSAVAPIVEMTSAVALAVTADGAGASSPVRPGPAGTAGLSQQRRSCEPSMDQLGIVAGERRVQERARSAKLLPPLPETFTLFSSLSPDRHTIHFG